MAHMMVKQKNKPGPRPRDLTGERFGRLVVVSYAGNQRWKCCCDCGQENEVWAPDLKRGKTKSCGCLQLEVAKTGDCRRTHGGSNSPEYRSWTSMIRRCSDEKCPGYERYGGRGISVCDRWKSFENFVADMGQRPKGMSIDRIDYDGNYEPDNCRWADAKTQSSNTSVAVLITANGKTQTLTDWSRETGLSTAAIRYRLKAGLSHDEAINRPARPHKRH